MQQALSIYLPTWSVDLVRRHWKRRGGPHDRLTILLTTRHASRETVVRCCEHAHHAGVRSGMSLAHARALLTGAAVHVQVHDPERERAALQALAGWATRWLPVVAADADETAQHPRPHPRPGLLADITGCQRLYKGEANLLRTVHDQVQRLGFAARLAAAPTFASAWAMARYGSDNLVSLGHHEVRTVLRDLPLAALRLDGEVIVALSELGVQWIGQLMALPRASLPGRFGDDLLLRLDQALGQAIETIVPVRTNPPPQVGCVFDGPVKQLEAIEQTARNLLSELCRLLLARESGVRRIDLTLDRSDLPPEQLHLALSHGSRDPRHLWALLRPKLERAHLGFGVEAMRMHARDVVRLPHQQTRHASVTGAAEQDAHLDQVLGQVLDAVATRLGDARASQVEPVETHLPERAFHYVKAQPARQWNPAQVVAAERPSLLFDSPRPVQVLSVTPEGPLVQIRWGGECMRVQNCVGPERISSEWWRHQATTPGTRDYYRVQDVAGQWRWLYQDQDTRQWFIHGLWA